MAENITWKNIKAKNVTTGIFVTQKYSQYIARSDVFNCLRTRFYSYYDNQKASGSDKSKKYSTEVNNFLFEDISGTLAPPKGVYSLRSSSYSCVRLCLCDPLTDNTDSIEFHLFKGSASKLTFRNIDIRPYQGKATVICDPSVFGDEDLANLGFECRTGLYAATA